MTPPRSTGAGLQISVRRWWGQGNASCECDAVITSTLARTYVRAASRKAGAAAGAGHARKQGKWRALVQAEPNLTRAFQFVPLAAESTGVLHSSTRQL